MAGLATRFGAAKLDAACAGRPLGAWAFDHAAALAAPVLAVVGPQPPAWLAPDQPRVVNPAPAAGLGGSVALAAQAAQAAGAGALLVVLADMPLVGPATLARLVALAATHGLAATRYPDDRRGVPACFAARHFAAMAALSGESGARDLLRRCPAAALVTPSADELLDVDRPADLAQVAALLAARADAAAGAPA
ncbi:NTP transferase domain-containing protein [Novosphingobium piscinae]|uniref:NTP transferase domain-containing protein n=1 Tax=Novosphingobium piscinae TaxID=1507448 RepID=A0A7X1G1A8_9SPHN|nr:NTP transferase domain-containing protein [Novosphingobium piscinae]MBC2670132.1 NTP transferase domain-containing protein [Novosphingobium piscinae]